MKTEHSKDCIILLGACSYAECICGKEIMMETAQLKKLAEFAGYESQDILTPSGDVIGVYAYIDDEETGVRYDPLHNDAQAFELLRKIVKRGYDRLNYIHDEGLWSCEGIEGQTLNEAICNAVLALLGDE